MIYLARLWDEKWNRIAKERVLNINIKELEKEGKESSHSKIKFLKAKLPLPFLNPFASQFNATEHSDSWACYKKAKRIGLQPITSHSLAKKKQLKYTRVLEKAPPGSWSWSQRIRRGLVEECLKILMSSFKKGVKSPQAGRRVWSQDSLGTQAVIEWVFSFMSDYEENKSWKLFLVDEMSYTFWR